MCGPHGIFFIGFEEVLFEVKDKAEFPQEVCTVSEKGKRKQDSQGCHIDAGGPHRRLDHGAGGARQHEERGRAGGKARFERVPRERRGDR